MNEIKAYFDGISHKKDPEQIAEDIIRRASSTAKRRRFRPAAAIAAAAVLMVGGVTAAAATGLLNINDIFGGRISAEDEVLAGGLVVAAEDFTWSVSDDDYMIELKGVTGSKSDMLLAYEIKRTDGKPVSEYMTNIPEDGVLDGFVDFNFSNERAFTTSVGSDEWSVNKDGNIEIYYQIITDGDLSGQHYSISGVNFYPQQIMWDYLRQQGEGIFMWGYRSELPVGFYDHVSIKSNKPLDIALNDENIIGLELEWSIAFTYSPSEPVALSKSIIDEHADVMINRWKYLKGAEETLECKLIQSKFSCVGGWIDVEFHCNTPYALDDYGTYYEKYNDVYLLLSDGSEFPCTLVCHGHNTYYGTNPITNIDIEVRYSNTVDGAISAVDIDKVRAVVINGEIFPLA